VVELSRLAVPRLGEVLLWVGILLACFIVGSGAVYVVRRRLRRDRDGPSGPSLTMSQVREMRERGEISEREYEALRRVVASQSKQTPAGGSSAL